jgi:Ca2+/Na+ antiporter
MNGDASAIGAVVVYALLVAGFVAFVVMEVRRWRGLGAFLSRTQVGVRVANMVLIGLLLLLMGVLYFDLVPSSALKLRIALVTLSPLIVLLILILAVWDFREIQKARLRREMEWYGEVAKTMVEEHDAPEQPEGDE